jgi:hypothetical protein
MSNASRCRSIAAHYSELVERTRDPELKRSYRRLEILWREMTPLAETYDRESDPHAKEQIYEMIDAVAEQRRREA